MKNYQLLFLTILIGLFGCDYGKSSSEKSEEETSAILPDVEDTAVSENPISKETEIKFTVAFIWEYRWEYEDEYKDYEDEAIADSGEMWAFYHPELKYWLLTRDDSYGGYGAMHEWVLCKPDGTYQILSIDEFGNKSTTTEKIEYQSPEKLGELYSATGKEKIFEYELFDNVKFKGREYRKTFLKTSDETLVYLADSDIDFAPIHNFNELQDRMEIRLPFYFPHDLPANKIMLMETTDAPYGKGKVELKWITPTEYYIYPQSEAEVIP